MADGCEERPLRKMADEFEVLAATLLSENNDVEVARFCEACSFIFPLFECLGSDLQFAKSEFVAKVNDLSAASDSISTLKSILVEDLNAGTVRKLGSHSRNLLRVCRALNGLKVLFELIIATGGTSFTVPATQAYSQALAPYHGWALRKAAEAGIHNLSTIAQLLRKLNEDDNSARICMRNYISASASVISYIENLFLSRDLGIDW